MFCGKEPGGRVDFNLNDPFRRREPLAARGISCDGAFHERRPDWQRRLGPGKVELPIVVEPDPDDAEQIRRIPREPAVMGRARFARGGQVEPAGAYPRPCAIVDHGLQKGSDHECHLRRENRLALLICHENRAGLRVRDSQNGCELGEVAAVGKSGIGSRHLNRGHLEGADSHRRIRLDLLVQTQPARQLRDLGVPHSLGQFDCGDVQRFGYRLPHRHLAEIFVLEVSGLVDQVLK